LPSALLINASGMGKLDSEGIDIKLFTLCTVVYGWALAMRDSLSMMLGMIVLYAPLVLVALVVGFAAAIRLAPLLTAKAASR
jgi:hypothetical protein